MSFEQTPERFKEYVAEALKNEEIRQGAVQAGLDDEVLAAEAFKNQDKAWKRVAQEVSDFNAVEQKYHDASAALEKAFPSEPRRAKTFFILAGLILVGYVLAGRVYGWQITASQVYKHPFASIFIFSMAWSLIYGIHSYLYVRSSREPREKRRRELGLHDQANRLEELRSQIKDSVITVGILQDLRQFINSQMEASYGNTLAVVSHTGLSQVFESRFEITTPANNQVSRLINSVPGASIGIAGPRGVGKTTLLGSLCRSEGAAAGNMLCVFTSAPVEYTAREYLLYLYSSVCRKVADPGGSRERKDSLRDLMSREAEILSRPARIWRPVGPMLVVSGLLFLSIGFGLAYLKLTATRSGQAISISELQGRTQTNPPSPSIEYSRALGVEPWPLVQWGITFALVGVFFTIYCYWDWFRRSDTKRDGERAKGPFSYLRALWPRPKSKEKPDPLKESADERLQEIRFQQSFSSGWSGALKLPIGVEGGATAGISWAKNQLSLPELVESFRNFLLEIRSRYSKIIICIDELDKLESDNQAHQFLNQIKAIFGIPGCFYLISVSENAISSFERRGLPFRDVFDSSLDTIIYMDYFDLAACKLLLARRVIGLPVPFAFLCYAMSGGLPRDLLRVCRELMELKDSDPTTVELSALCEKLVRREVESKLRAISIASQQIKLQEQVSEFLSHVAVFGTNDFTATKLLQEYLGLLASHGKRATATKQTDAVITQFEMLSALRLELAAYLYHSATLMEFISLNAASQTFWKGPELNRIAGELAAGRQALTIDPRLSIARMSEFRKSQGLRVG